MNTNGLSLIGPSKIEKGVPLPRGRAKRGSYDFGTIKAGDCAFFPVVGADIQALREGASKWKERHPGWDYVTRKAVVDGVHGVRLWRLS